MRILISAFAISPYRGSEAGVGWEFALRLARDHDVTVIYGDLNERQSRRQELEAWKEANEVSTSMRLVYVAPSRVSMLLESLHSRPGLRPLYYTAYQLWQKEVLEVARALHGEERFDLVHQLTYTGIWEPGYLWKLGIPFFWGPITGGNVAPLRYLPILGVIGGLEAVARRVLNAIMLPTHPRIGAAARRASHLWCVTDTEKRILGKLNSQTSEMPVVGTPDEVPEVRRALSGHVLRLIWSGAHLPNKALPLLIRALAALRSGGVIEAHILGEARVGRSDTKRAKQLAERLGVSSNIRWHGNLPRAEALKSMRGSDVLVLTSLLEGTPTVVIEALSMGMPVICHDACGMALAVTPECGIKVPMTGIDDSVKGFAAAIQTLLDHPEMVEQLSKGAIKRAGELGWDAKIAEINRAYEEALAPRVANV